MYLYDFYQRFSRVTLLNSNVVYHNHLNDDEWDRYIHVRLLLINTFEIC